MKALNNYVIFTPIEEKKAKSAIILSTEEKPLRIKGLVVSVGSLCTKIKEKDIILIPKYADAFEIEGVSYLVTKEEELVAKF